MACEIGKKGQEIAIKRFNYHVVTEELVKVIDEEHNE